MTSAMPNTGQLIAYKAPSISAEMLDHLEAAFPVITIKPGVTVMDEVMYNAGAREVITWIRAKSSVKNSGVSVFDRP